jgi:nucleotide-binding universal stress UspA family protein
MTGFKNILFVSEPNQQQAKQLSKAMEIARSHQAKLKVVEVIPPASTRHLPDVGIPGPDTLFNARKQAALHRLNELTESVGPAAGITTEVLSGTRFLSVIERVLLNGHDLVVKPAENPDWLSRLFGSDDMHLLRKCPCPVWMMKSTAQAELRTVVACIDVNPDEPPTAGNSLNDQILDFAITLATANSASLHIIHAWESEEAGFASLWASDPEAAERDMLRAESQQRQNIIDRLTWRLRKQLDADNKQQLQPRWHLDHGEPHRVIPEKLKTLSADIVVMGTVARTGVPGLIIGNTAEAILDQLECSVLAIKPNGFKSPVQAPKA